MPGDVPDPVLVEARRALLDAVDALSGHRERIVLVGAQAIYLHTEEVTMGVALFTKDADLALLPPLGDDPNIERAMLAAGFKPGRQPGIWLDKNGQVDLLVPEGLAPAGGRRAARLKGHGERVARKVLGLEGCAVDRETRAVGALDPSDRRSVLISVASPAALLVSKLHKVGDRRQAPRADRRSAQVAETALRLLDKLFGIPDSLGCVMAGRYVQGVADPETVRLSAASLAQELRRSLT